MKLKYFVLSMACVMAVALTGCSASRDTNSSAPVQPTNSISSNRGDNPSAGVGSGAQNSAGVGSGTQNSAAVDNDAAQSGAVGGDHGQDNASGTGRSGSAGNNVIDDIGDAAGDLTKGAGDVVQDAGNAIGNAANDVGSAMR